MPAAAVAGEGDRLAADPAAGSALGVEPSGSTRLVSDEEASRRRFVDDATIGVDAAALGISATRVPTSSSAPIPGDERDPCSLLAKTPDPRRRNAWADLLQRVFEVDALLCPQCGDRMRILSAITEPDVARRILAWLDMPSRAPPHGSPTEGSGGSDAQLAPELPWVEDPGFDFDQSLPGDE